MARLALNGISEEKIPRQDPPANWGEGPGGKRPARYSPTVMMVVLMVAIALAALLAESAEIVFRDSVEAVGLTITAMTDFLEISLLLLLSYILLYRPFKKEWIERAISDQALRESEERLRFALNGSKSGLWDWDISTGKAYFSPSGEQILGYAPGDMEHSIQTWESLLHPQDRPRVMQVLNEHLEGRSSFYETEHRLLAKSGDWIWIDALGQVITRDEKGRPLRMVGTFIDVTLRKKTEEQIHRLSWHLFQTSEEERKHLSHDLYDQWGQLVTVLQLGIGVLKRYQLESPQIAQCQELIALTAQLSDEFRIAASHLRPPALDIGLVPALESELDRIRPHANAHRITLQAPGLERERFRPEAELALFRVCQEAINNALQHARCRYIDIRLQRQRSEILLSVGDVGVGFDPEQVGPQEGTLRGIGLVGMRERLVSLGGRLEVVSAPGQGTTVIACLTDQQASQTGPA
jgi:two-component system sensor histidine kinase UhpB